MGLLGRLFKARETVPAVESIPVTGSEEGRISYPRVYQPGSKVDWRVEAGGRRLDTNGVVAIAINHYQTNWSQARLCAGHWVGGEFQEAPNHPMVLAVEDPNPWYGSDTLWDGSIVSALVGGNAFWGVTMRQGGDPAFVYLPHLNVDIVGGKRGEFIGEYQYRIPGEGTKVTIKPQNMLHFRRGVAMEDQKLGMVALQTLIREVGSDNLAAAYSGGLLKNFGATALILAATENMGTPDPEMAESYASLFRNMFSVDGAGKVAIIPFPLEEVSKGFSPEEMSLSSLRDVPVSRILAALGLNAMALDLPSENKTYANYGEAIEATWRQGILPTMDRMAQTLTRFARKWYGDPALVIRFDSSNIDALAPDQDALFGRWGTLFKSGVCTRLEAKRGCGLDFDQTKDDVYFDEVLGSVSGADKAVTDAAKKRAIERRQRLEALDDEPGQSGSEPS